MDLDLHKLYIQNRHRNQNRLINKVHICWKWNLHKFLEWRNQFHINLCYCQNINHLHIHRYLLHLIHNYCLYHKLYKMNYHHNVYIPQYKVHKWNCQVQLNKNTRDNLKRYIINWNNKLHLGKSHKSVLVHPCNKFCIQRCIKYN